MKLLFKNLLFTLLVPGTVAVYLPWLIGAHRFPGFGPASAVGALLTILGIAIYVWCVWDFARLGRGTPAPIDAPKKLVIRGLYRYSRNPMYVGVLTTILGWAVFFQTPVLLLLALLVGSGFRLFVVWYEEPHLRRTFGAEYDAYCARVGRWLPRWRSLAQAE